MKKPLRHFRIVLVLMIMIFKLCIVSAVASASDNEKPPILGGKNKVECWCLKNK